MTSGIVSSKDASAESLVDTVGAVAADCCRARLPLLKSVIMIGSMGRGEATWERTAVGWRVIGDAEFVAVQDGSRATPEEVSALCDEISAHLTSLGIEVSVDVSIVKSSWFSRLGNTIFAYEIKQASRVVFGDASVLNEIPAFSTAEIEREDAWRLLCNRIVEWLEVPEDSSQRRYREVKLALDIASSLLVFAGRFEPSYAKRSLQLQELAKRNKLGLQFETTELSILVSKCTEYKLGRTGPPKPELLSKASLFAWKLAEWEEQQMIVRNRPLMHIRGWAYVVRATGWLRGARNWHRWAALAFKNTPRSLVYSAAKDTLAVLIGLRELRDAARTAAQLPIACVADMGDVASVARQIAWNYRMFVEKSRA